MLNKHFFKTLDRLFEFYLSTQITFMIIIGFIITLDKIHFVILEQIRQPFDQLGNT